MNTPKRALSGILLLFPLLVLSGFPAPAAAAHSQSQAAPARTVSVTRSASDPSAAGYPSLEALVEDAVAKLNARDTAALGRMSFGREEFLQAYPLFESDTSRARRAFAVDFYLEDNRKVLARRLEQEGGKSLEVSRIEVQGVRGERKGFELCRGLKVWVLRGDAEVELRFLKSVARTESGWKIWSYEDD